MNRFLAPADETPNAFGGWFEHVRSFEALVRSLGPGRACVIEYEEMHADLRGCLARLAALLGEEAVARLHSAEGEAIEQALHFDAMKASGGAKAVLRKGVAGGWREHFSEEDEARVAAALEQRLPRTEGSLAGVGRWR